VSKKRKIALIGCGVMGHAIGSRLLKTGHTVIAFDVDPAKVAQMTAQGAEAASTASDAASRSDAVVLSLNSAAIVREAVFGSTGVVKGAAAGTVVIDKSNLMWQRRTTGWNAGGIFNQSWLNVLAMNGPLRVIHQADVQAPE